MKAFMRSDAIRSGCTFAVWCIAVPRQVGHATCRQFVARPLPNKAFAVLRVFTGDVVDNRLRGCNMLHQIYLYTLSGTTMDMPLSAHSVGAAGTRLGI